MAYIKILPAHSDARGSLSVIDNILPFEIKRVYFIHDVPTTAVRGGHRHHKTIQALVCVKGSCVVKCNDGNQEESYFLNDPTKCLIVDPKDYHTMSEFTLEAVLLVISSEHYDRSDYIDENYK